jgi:GrpB-like predicted nucleotidyltransferase (UPF0157 family)
MVIVLEEHDPRWAAGFAVEAAALRQLLGPVAAEVHHVGSTAVEGLVAKPILDLLLVVPGLEAIDALRPALEGSAYRWRGENGVPGRRYLVRPDARAPMGEAAHVHAFPQGHAEIARHLRFRDALRGSATLRSAYAALKHSLLRAHPADRRAYTDGKGPFIEAVLRGA